jgi:hypothetical protein
MTLVHHRDTLPTPVTAGEKDCVDERVLAQLRADLDKLVKPGRLARFVSRGFRCYTVVILPEHCSFEAELKKCSFRISEVALDEYVNESRIRHLMHRMAKEGMIPSKLVVGALTTSYANRRGHAINDTSRTVFTDANYLRFTVSVYP